MRKRTLTSLLVALAVLTALGVALYLRAKAPPEAARLLPESDAIFYIQLKEIRTATHFDQTPLPRSADFQRFIDSTGIVPERDIDAAAFALHRMDDPFGPNGSVAYSEVFVGRFDGVKLAQYMASIAAGQEMYGGRTIYTLPVEHRQLRIAQLGYDTIGVSNMPTSEQIHSMLDRARASAVATPGSSLLAARYREVPLLSQVWGIGHIGLPFSEDGKINVMGLELPLTEDTDLVASLRYNAAAHLLAGGTAELRVEEFAPDAASAQRTVESLTTLLGLVRAVVNAKPVDEAPDKASAQAITGILQSVTIAQKNDHAVLSAGATVEQIKALTARHATPAGTPASK